MKTKMYLHSNKESNHDLGKQLGLSDEELKNFLFALYEVEFDVEVASNGDCKILAVNGIPLDRPDSAVIPN